MHWGPGWLHARTHVAYGHGVDLNLRKLLTASSAHVCTISHELRLVLLEFGVFNQTLVLADATLLEATESEDGKTDGGDSTNGRDDSDLGSG